jgi:hypothetical protein
MAFDRNALHAVAATAGGFTLWHYRTTDGEDDLERPDYWFNATELRPLDRIMIDCKPPSAQDGIVCCTMIVGWNGYPDGWLDWRVVE